MLRFEEMRNNPTCMHIAKVCDENGYVLERMYVNEHGTPFLTIDKKEQKSYLPAIYFRETSGNKFEFEIQTTSYGALNIEQYEKFITACKNAYSVVKSIPITDFSMWPIIDSY